MELKGIGVSPGLAVGRALVVRREVFPVFRMDVAEEGVEAELGRLTRAVEASRLQLLAVKQRLSHEVGLPHAYIFDAHLLMLDDPLLLERALALVREQRVNAEWALHQVSDHLHALFEGLTDPYLRERSRDLDDVLGRILLNLRGAGDAPSLSRLPGSFVLVAEDLTPSEAAELDWGRVVAVATDTGSPTHHTSILARSFGVPAVVGLGMATREVPAGALVAVDGTRGRLVVEPSVPALATFRADQERLRLEGERLQETRTLPAETRDGVVVRLLANAEFADEAGAALRHGAEGIGLFRSEYLLGRARQFPSEERQVELYRRLLEEMGPRPVTVRLWDIGAEDFVPGGPSSPNPALGERALRLVHRDPRPFVTQVRALLRAAEVGPLRILFPFVAGLTDLRQALDLVAEAREGLRRDGLPHRPDPPLGLTLEVPSAVVMADVLAPHVSFLAVGTNDLIQYLLAVDRVDPRVAPLYQPLHPAVLRLLRQVVGVARAFDRPLTVCGEMAAELLPAIALVGLGVRELSMTPAAIPRVKAALRGIHAAHAEAAVRACLDLPGPGEVEARLRADMASALAPLSELELKGVYGE